MAPRARVLERLSQALARLRSDRPLHRDIIDRASVVPTDQQGDRQPPAPAAGRQCLSCRDAGVGEAVTPWLASRGHWRRPRSPPSKKQNRNRRPRSPMARPIFAAALGAASRAGGERWRGPGAVARARLIRALRPPSRGPLCASFNHCSAENKESQHSTAQTAAAAYRHCGRLFPQGRIAPSAESIQWPSQGGYEPKGHELGFTAAFLLSDFASAVSLASSCCRLLGAKRCRSSIS
jgi:hypothetical protein